MRRAKYFLVFFTLLLLWVVPVSASKKDDSTNLTFLNGSEVTAKNVSSSTTSTFTGITPRLSSSISKSTKDAAVKKIYKSMLNFQTSVDLSEFQIPYSSEVAVSLLDGALESDFYLFNTLTNHSDLSVESNFCSCYTSGGYIHSYVFQYQASASTLKKEYQALKTKVKSIRKSLNVTGKSKAQIVLAVHDYIALHTSYDTTNQTSPKNRTAYGALIKQKAICSGYTLAAQLLLSTYGISSEIATSDSMNHAWNLVNLSGKWYHMDITWDDPYPSKKNYVAYWFFLKTDQQFKNHSISKHYDWDSSGIQCTSSSYSKIPLADNSKLVHVGNTWYYAKSNQIVSLKLTGKKLKTVVKLSSKAKISSIKIKKKKLTYSYILKGKKKTGSKKL
jgi:transglutaminase/protease-like cytokinesis protein 3